MRTFTLEIDVNHAAFEPDPSIELARILREIANEIEAGRNLSHWQELHTDWSVGEIGKYVIKEPMSDPDDSRD